MKLVSVSVIVGVVLMGCSSSAIPEQAQEQRPDTEPGVDASVSDSAVEDGSVVIEDASTDSDSGHIPTQAEEDEACRQTYCSNVPGSQCGVLSSHTCNGRPIDCGACAKGYYCGDNAVANYCGYGCEESGLKNNCGDVGFTVNATWDYNKCQHQPYYLNSITGAFEGYRPNGFAGCVFHQTSGNTLWCCP